MSAVIKYKPESVSDLNELMTKYLNRAPVFRLGAPHHVVAFTRLESTSTGDVIGYTFELQATERVRA